MNQNQKQLCKKKVCVLTVWQLLPNFACKDEDLVWNGANSGWDIWLIVQDHEMSLRPHAQSWREGTENFVDQNWDISHHCLLLMWRPAFFKAWRHRPHQFVIEAWMKGRTRAMKIDYAKHDSKANMRNAYLILKCYEHLGAQNVNSLNFI